MAASIGASQRWFYLDGSSNLGFVAQSAAPEQGGATSPADKAGSPFEGLGEDAFLRLLSTQLRYQNPLEPVQDSAFVAQLAQFSALEQMQNLNQGFKAFQQASDRAQQLADALALLGKTVTLGDPQKDGVQGEVSAVQLVDGVPKLLIDGKLYGLDTLREVSRGDLAPR